MNLKKPPLPRLIHVNDSADIREIVRDILSHMFEIQEFDEMFDAVREATVADLLLVDMSSVSPLHLGPAGAYSIMYRWMLKHPNCPIIVLSGISGEYVKDVLEKIKELEPSQMPVVDYVCMGSGMKSDLLMAIKDLGFLEQEDIEGVTP